MAFNKSIFCHIANHPTPETFPPNVYFSHTEHTITIFDAYPKAEYHLLVIPRVSNRDEDRVRTPKSLLSLKTLFSTPGIEKKDIREFLETLEAQADALKEELEEDMRIRRGFVWKLYFGFHAVQSME